MHINISSEVSAFIKEQGGTLPMKLRERLGKLEKYDWGSILRSGALEKLEKGLYEIRFLMDRTRFRFICTPIGSELHLLVAFIKKSKKIPLRYLKTARQRMKYLNSK